MKGVCKDKNKKKYNFEMITSEKPDPEKGISGGKIIMLRISDKNKKDICFFDEEWVQKPQKDNEKYLLDIFCRRYN